MPKKILFFLVLVLVLAGCSKGELLENFSGPVDPENQETILVTVPAGTGSEGIADLLYEKELIQNRLVFKEMAKDTGYDRKFQAGDYALSPSMDLKTIIEKIGTGDVVAARTTSFTIPEGFELVQIIDKMVAAGYAARKKSWRSSQTVNFPTGSWTRSTGPISSRDFCFRKPIPSKRGSPPMRSWTECFPSSTRFSRTPITRG